MFCRIIYPWLPKSILSSIQCLVPVSEQHPVYSNQQSVAFPPDSVASYQFQRGLIPHSSVVQLDQRNLRFATIVTVLIVLATFVLLGFSVYLPVQLGFIALPFFNGGASPTPGAV